MALRQGVRKIHIVDAGMPHEIAAMLEPFGVAVHAVMEGSGVSGLNVTIAGCGPIGLMVATRDYAATGPSAPAQYRA